jgi:hypothetical protein
LFIPVPDPDFLSIPDPGSRGQKDPGSQIRIRSSMFLIRPFGAKVLGSKRHWIPSQIRIRSTMFLIRPFGAKVLSFWKRKLLNRPNFSTIFGIAKKEN